jgi:Pirin C-terminal cupin domain
MPAVTVEDILVLPRLDRHVGEAGVARPIVHYGPFVMNSREEIAQAVRDFEQGRLGTIPADQIAPRHFA